MQPPQETPSELHNLRTLADAAAAWARWQRARAEGVDESPEAAALLETLDRLAEATAESRSVVPLCASCRRTREGEQWIGFEDFAAGRLGVEFTHGLCPDCIVRLYPEHSPD